MLVVGGKSTGLFVFNPIRGMGLATLKIVQIALDNVVGIPYHISVKQRTRNEMTTSNIKFNFTLGDLSHFAEFLPGTIPLTFEFDGFGVTKVTQWTLMEIISTEANEPIAVLYSTNVSDPTAPAMRVSL
jgi:hypothetical protein